MRAVDSANTAESRRDDAIAGIAKACAAVGDGHTRINASPASRFPLALRAESLNACMDPILMRGLGLADEGGLHLTIDSSTYTIAETDESYAWTYAIAPGAPTAISRQNPDEQIWYSILEADLDTLYLAFRSCRSDAGPVFDEVIRTLGEHAEITRLIVDMRTNSGGDSRPGYRFARQLSGTGPARRRGGVVVLVGPYTFSSALMNAADILKACGSVCLSRAWCWVGLRGSGNIRPQAGYPRRAASSLPQQPGFGPRPSKNTQEAAILCWIWCSPGIDFRLTCTSHRRVAA